MTQGMLIPDHLLTALCAKLWSIDNATRKVRLMNARVLRPGYDFEVFGPIIPLAFVLVVNDLIRC